jgi:hypothetical protein
VSESNWRPVEIDWANDVGIAKALSTTAAAMATTASFDVLVGYYDGQRENVKYLTPAGRRKWEQAYAANVLRLVAPRALRPEWVYVASVSRAALPGESALPVTTLHDSMADAVRVTIRLLILAGEFYSRMTPAAIRELAADLAAQRWEAAYGTLRREIRGMTVAIDAKKVSEPPAEPPFTLDPAHGTEDDAAPAGPAPTAGNTTIEYRYGRGGKGGRGSYLVAEVTELYDILTAGRFVTKAFALSVLNRIRAAVAAQPGEDSNEGALAEWATFLETAEDDAE